MTDDVQTQGIDPNAKPEGVPAEGGDPNVAPPTLEEVQAKRNAENLERAKAGGYVEPAAPSISERAIALVDGVARAIEHNAPISREHFEEMKALLGYREGEQIDPPAGV